MEDEFKDSSQLLTSCVILAHSASGHVGMWVLTHKVIYDITVWKLHCFGRASSVLQFSTCCSVLHQIRDPVIAPLYGGSDKVLEILNACVEIVL